MLSDLRYALRSLRRSPAFTAVAVVTLALGIGANATVFSWIEGLVLDPIPAVREPTQLVGVKLVTKGGGITTEMSYPAFVELREHAHAVQGLSAYQMYQFGVQHGANEGAAEPVWGAFATSDYFTTLGVLPLVGRTFLPSDDVSGAEPVAVLGYGLWQRVFGGDPLIVGRRVRLNGHDVTVIGVAPPGFAGAFSGFALHLWVPLGAYDRLGDHAGKLQQANAWWLTVFGRLQPSASMAQARAELDAIGPRMAAARPDIGAKSAAAEPYDAGGAGSVLGPTFAALLGVTGLVFLIVCVNLANLLLARATTRQRELAVRSALGAGRRRLVRQLLVECLVLAAPGAVLGVAIAAWGRDALMAIVPHVGLPVALDTPLDARVLAAVVALSLLAVLVFGLAPALRASRPDLATTLKSGTPGSGIGRSRLRSAFVVAQVALSLVVIVSAALFGRTLYALDDRDPGFGDPAHVLLVNIDFGLAGVRDSATMRSTLDQVLERTAAIPGVTGVAAADQVPMGLFQGSSWGVSIPGYEPSRFESMSPRVTFVTPSYFSVMGMPVMRGRALGASDPARGPDKRIVVNEAFVRRFLVGRDPIGVRVGLAGAPEPDATIVGVVSSVLPSFGDIIESISAPPRPAMYLSYAGAPQAAMTLHVRTSGDPLAMLPLVRRAVAETAPALAVFGPETLADHARGAFALQRLGADVLGVLGIIALLLAALGLYGVTVHLVTQRTHEVGVRIALGATQRQVLTLFVTDGLRLAAIGVGLGTLAALAAGKLLASQLYGVRAHDPPTLIGTALLLSLVALAASYLPARRATRVDPIIALRAD